MVALALITDELLTVRRAEAFLPLPESERQQLAAWPGQHIDILPDVQWDWEHLSMTWGTRQFQVQTLRLSGGQQCILLQRPALREQLLEAALNQVDYGIQVYDADASIVFFNRASKEELLNLPRAQNIEGQTLLDVFTVDPDYSTTLTALRRKAPVIRRFDRYKSTIGAELETITSAWPVENDGGQIIGGVALERNIRMTKQLMETVQTDQRTLLEHRSIRTDSGPNTRYTLRDLIGSDPALLQAKELARKMALRDNNILIQGETGTGKEIFAKGIHNLSPRRQQKFVAVNCAAFPENLIEGMLFGTVKGAFTGSTDKAGLMEEANGGTLFLDELNSMSLGMQAKLLRALQERTIQRIGGTAYLPIDVRVIASCNEDAYDLSETGKLRKDLFYRLASVVIDIPPLRERPGDLKELVWHYVRSHGALAAQPVAEIRSAFWKRLEEHRWPGNVRELFHILEYALSVSEGGVLTGTEFPAYFRRLRTPVVTAETALPVPSQEERGLAQMVRDYERGVLRQAYEDCGRNATKTAQCLRISRQNMQYYLKKYGLNHDGPPEKEK